LRFRLLDSLHPSKQLTRLQKVLVLLQLVPEVGMLADMDGDKPRSQHVTKYPLVTVSRRVKELQGKLIALLPGEPTPDGIQHVRNLVDVFCCGRPAHPAPPERSTTVMCGGEGIRA
jgi:hypothetical protein